MNPDLIFGLNEVHKADVRDELEYAAGIYRLRLGSSQLVRHTNTGRPVTSTCMRIGRSKNLYRRLRTYFNARSRNDKLNQFVETHRVQIRVDVELLPESYLDEAEAEALWAHATAKGRLPRFNSRGEFDRACRWLGLCATKAQRERYVRPWLVDSRGGMRIRH